LSVGPLEHGTVLGNLHDLAETGNVIARPIQRGRAIRLLDDRVTGAAERDAGEAMRHDGRGSRRRGVV
jgi:hypothetical protein